MSGFSHRRHTVMVVFCAALALPFVCAAGDAAHNRTGIYMKIQGINGGIGHCTILPSTDGWIRVTALAFGGQQITESSPWFITPPPGVKEVTLTKLTDKSTAGLSSAFALKKTLPPVLIDLCLVDAAGILKGVYRYTLNNAVVSSFATTAPGETVVLSFASLATGISSAAPVRRPVMTPTPVPRVKDIRRRLVAPTPTPRGD
jgi:type VI protein secretion system component Hcp